MEVPFGSNLTYHPHVHCLATGGGLGPDGQTWLPGRDNYLVPVRALSRLFRGLFLDRLRKKFEAIALPESLWKKDWVVYCKPAVQGSRKVLNYLGRYIHRIAITNSRILSIDNGKVSFRYRGTGTGQAKTMTVNAEEFIRRFLQHVLPARVHKVRYYGLWSSSNREHLVRMQQVLTPSGNNEQGQEEEWEGTASVPPEPRPCPHCQVGTFIKVRRLPPQGRAPP